MRDLKLLNDIKVKTLADEKFLIQKFQGPDTRRLGRQNMKSESIYIISSMWRLVSTNEFFLFPAVHHFGDGMPDHHPRSLNFFLRQPRRNAHLERWLKLPSNVLGRSVDRARHAFHPGDQHPIC